MRQPTKDEVRAIDFAHADAAIASGEHDLYMLELRRVHSVLGENAKLPLDVLTAEQREKLSGLEATAKTRGVEVGIALARLRQACEASKDAQLVDGLWISPLTRKPYGDSSNGGS